MTPGGEVSLADIQATLKGLKGSVDSALVELKGLKKSRRNSRLLFVAIGVLLVVMGFLTYYVWSSAKQGRQDLAESIESAQHADCLNSEDFRVRLRDAFHQLFVEVEAAVTNPEDVQAIEERFNTTLDNIVPNRDCEQEAAERRNG